MGDPSVYCVFLIKSVGCLAPDLVMLVGGSNS